MISESRKENLLKQIEEMEFLSNEGRTSNIRNCARFFLNKFHDKLEEGLDNLHTIQKTIDDYKNLCREKYLTSKNTNGAYKYKDYDRDLKRLETDKKKVTKQLNTTYDFIDKYYKKMSNPDKKIFKLQIKFFEKSTHISKNNKEVSNNYISYLIPPTLREGIEKNTQLYNQLDKEYQMRLSLISEMASSKRLNGQELSHFRNNIDPDLRNIFNKRQLHLQFIETYKQYLNTLKNLVNPEQRNDIVGKYPDIKRQIELVEDCLKDAPTPEGKLRDYYYREIGRIIAQRPPQVEPNNSQHISNQSINNLTTVQYQNNSKTNSNPEISTVSSSQSSSSQTASSQYSPSIK
ncbi:MAG: hypothetical protein K5769_00150 [Pseudobutyrivibrio sp.]|nr:hypothetical protein [Pseudobutyrivibrio sp.]